VGFAEQDNTASLRVLEKAGLIRKGFISGLESPFAYFNNECYFELMKDEWVNRIGLSASPEREAAEVKTGVTLKRGPGKVPLAVHHEAKRCIAETQFHQNYASLFSRLARLHSISLLSSSL
jgi:hypothetical protein